MRLQTKCLLVMVPLVVAPLLILGAVSYVQLAGVSTAARLDLVWLILVTILLVALLAVAGLVVVLKYILLIPLKKIIQVADESGRSSSVDMNSGDEIMGLGQVFNNLYRDLEKSQQTIEECQKSLESRVQERTHELQIAMENAKSASTAKSEFLATMSHEIRTPMNGVLGMTEILIDSGLNEKQQGFAEAVIRSGKALLAILNDVLDFSKIEAGKLELDHGEFDLRDNVEDVMELLAESAQKKDLELACLIAQDTPVRLLGDAGRMRQILVNIIGNAIKFTERGEVVVRVGMDMENEPGVCLRFTVTDTGIGIQPQVQEKVFNSFSQADSSTTRRYGGSGLGLAISQQLVRLMGGEIGVSSEVGLGSTFWFTLRLELGVDLEAVLKPLNFSRLRVLVVDDNATNREILSYHLESWNIRHASVSGGSQALAKLHRSADLGDPFNLVVLDMYMPGMDGLSLAKTIKSDPALAEIRMIMLSSVFMADTAKMEREAGILRHLTKPVRQSQLYDCIASAMGVKLDIPAHAAPLHEADSGEFTARVLVAEDNPVNYEVARWMLESLGCQVDVVENGQQALNISENQAYDLIFMDGQMPELDGYEATKQIRVREQDSGRYTPIIALTANVLAGERERCLQVGMDDYIPSLSLGDWQANITH